MAERPTRRWLLGSGLTLSAGGGIGWFLFRDTPDNWQVPFEFLTDASVFYDRWEAKKRDPTFWWAALTQPELHAIGWEGDGQPWSVSIEGDGVDRTTTINEVALRAIAAADGTVPLLKTMRCSGDSPQTRLASNAVWSGVPLSTLLRRAGLRPAARRIRITSRDGFTANLEVDALTTADGRRTLLALQLNGAPLSHERGGPVRLIVPDRFGFKNVKWPARFEVTTDDQTWGNHEVVTGDGFDSGEVSLGSKILKPDLRKTNSIAHASRGPMVLAGVAFGGTAPVARVDVKLGADSPWEKARLPVPKELREHTEASRAWQAVGERWPLPDVWTPWTIHWSPSSPGDYRIQVRATNSRRQYQDDKDNDLRDADSSMATGIVRVS